MKKREEHYLASLLKHKGFIQFMERTLAFVIIFLIEALLIKIFVDFTFEPDIPSAIFIDFRAPLTILVAVITFYIIARRKLLKIEKLAHFSYKLFYLWILSNIIFFLSFFKLNLFMSSNPFVVLSNRFLFAFMWYLLAIGLGITLFFAFFRLKYVLNFFKFFKKEIIASLVIAVIFRFIYSYFSFTWRFFSGIVAKMVYFLLNLSYNEVFLSDYINTPIIRVGDFGAKIFAPCSGIEGMTLFLTFFILTIVIGWSFINHWKALFLLVIGAAGAFLVNVLRVYALFLIGATWSPEIALGLFHSNVGWILFSVYFILFEFCTYNWMRLSSLKSVKKIKL